MKNGLKRIQPLLVIVISSLLVICPAYLQYNDLMEIDFLSLIPGFENPDSDNLLAYEQNKAKIFVSTLSPVISPIGISWMGQAPQFSFYILFPDRPFTVLRC